MKKSIVLILTLSVVLLTGCDFLRKVAGRPTAKEVEEIRVERIRQEEERHQARLDSMRRVQQQMADSLAALEAFLLDSLSQAKGTVLTPATLGGIGVSTLEHKYCIVVGAFRDLSNAVRKKQSCDGAGYPADIVSFRNGLNAVTICGGDNLSDVLKQFNALRGGSVCPKDSWILVNK